MRNLTRTLYLLAGLIIAATFLLSTFSPLQSKWCESVSLFCSSAALPSESKMLQVSNLNGCQPRTERICINARPFSRLIASSVQFEKESNPLDYFRTGAPNEGETAIGVYQSKDDPITAKSVCMTMWSTSARCGDLRPALQGHLKGQEWVSLF
jgi:hypothetical protein